MISTRLRKLAAPVVCAMSLPFMAGAQTSYYTTNGAEYDLIGSVTSDQMFPDVALATSGGFVVWQDNATDGSGWGISARRLDSTLSGTLGSFRVNVQGSNDQQNARVAMLKNGGAAFVWQGGKASRQHIYARLLATNNTFLSTNDLLVSTFTNHFQINPALAVLNNSNIVVVWASFNQASSNSLLDVYAKILSPSGVTVSNEFRINQFTNFNQRSPVVAALKSGGFVVAWVSEQQRLVAPVLGSNSTASAASSTVVPSVDIYARLYKSNGAASASEFLVNADASPCANPVVGAATDGGFMVAWSTHDTLIRTNGWDVCARSFATNGLGGNVVLVNTRLTGNQYAPRISVIGLDYLVVWTSLSQDGSREGVYGRFIHNDGTPTGGEFRVNTTTISQQMQPAVASDGLNQYLAIWTSYTGNPYSFELFAQRYINVDAVLQAMPAPFVYVPFTLSNNVYQPQLQISWTPLAGISVSNYEIYVDGAVTPMAVTQSNLWIMTAANGLTANSSHSFQLDYVKTSGSRSPLSASTSATTWGGMNWGGIPFEWMTTYYGSDVSTWPSTGKPLTGSGMTLSKVFLSGGNPLDSSTWLTQHLSNTKQGMFLTWNTQPGLTYQVQVTSNFVDWSNFGSPRFAAGVNDSVYVGGHAVGYYRVLLLR